MTLPERPLDLQIPVRSTVLTASRVLYGLGIAGLGLQQLVFGTFLQGVFPAWPYQIPGLSLWARVVGAVFVSTGVAIIWNRKARAFSLALAGLLLAFLCFSSIPYELLIDPYNNYVGSWTNALTNLALTGGALTIAGSYPTEPGQELQEPGGSRAGKVALPGKLFFSITILVYGITHFLYTKHLVPLVPGWIPYPLFWTYFAGVALIGAGSALILGIRQRRIAFLLGTMLFLWVFLVHLPSVRAHPSANSPALSSLLMAVVYSATAFVIAVVSPKRNRRPEGKGMLQEITASYP